MSIGYKLMLSYMLFVIIPISIIGYYSYNSSSNAVRAETELGIASTLQQTQANIQYRLTDMQRAAGQLYFDQQFQNALFDYSGGWEGVQTVTQEIEPRINATISLISFNVRMNIYIADPTFPEHYYIYNGNPIDLGKTYAIYHRARIENSAWYVHYVQQGVSYGSWQQVDDDARYNNISYLMTITNFQNGQNLGLIRITANLSDVFDAIYQIPIGTGGFVVIIDAQQELKLTTLPSFRMGRQYETIPGYLRVKETLPDLNWSLLAYVPQMRFQQDIDQIRTITIGLCGLIFVLLSFLGWYLSLQFSRRVMRITKAFRHFQIGDFQQRLSEQGMDEFALIEQAFNEMARNVETLVHEIYVTRLKKKEAELNMLQAQINPHFLYNTLSAISRLGRLGAVETLQEMVLSLAKFYRLSLNKGKIFISVDNELERIRAYLDIQKIRYGKDVVVFYDIDLAIRHYITLKLLLQPFVENILEHARFMGPIHIRIVAYKEEATIVFKVIDDGIGMHEDMLEQLLYRHDDHYGIYNVDQRIKLQYGESYGVSLYSDFGIGTTVKIVIPALDQVAAQKQQLLSGPLVQPVEPLSSTAMEL